MDKMVKYIDCYVPTELCNLSCDYCYVRQKRDFNNKIMVLPHSIKKMGKAFSQERLCGKCLINLCAGGETLLADDIVPFTEALLKEGHYVSVVTNGTLSKAFDKLMQIDSEYIKHLFIKFSFHYLELKKRNLFEVFFNNVKKIRDAGASFTLEMMASDNLIPHIPEIKDICIKNVGALPHLSLIRNDLSKQMEIITELPINEFKKVWSQFDSEMFNLKIKIYDSNRIRYCYAGKWTSHLNLSTGKMNKCFGSASNNNIYEVDKPLEFTAVGNKCPLAYCFNCHSYYAMGIDPETEVATYAQVRDRIDINTGKHWLNEDVYNFFNQKFYDNFEYDPKHYRGENYYNYNNKKIIIFGAGMFGNETYYAFGSENVVYFADNNKSLVGTEKHGKEIISFDRLKEIHNDYDIVIAVSDKYYAEIANQFIENGIENFYSAEQLKIKYNFESRTDKNIILFNVAEHTNIGDHAITEATEKFLSEYCNDYNIIEVTVQEGYKESEYIRQYIAKDDILVISGGGFLGSLHIKGELVVRNVIENYPDNKIIVFPQSMYFENNEYGKSELQKSVSIYNTHNDLHIFFREKFSYDLAVGIFAENVHKYLVPDIVLTLNNSDGTVQRDKIALFFRTDKEKIVSRETTNKIKALLENRNVDYIESSMHDNDSIYLYMRKEKVQNKLDKFKTYKLVITDTLHCMIFCAITGTPCIAFNNISRKVEGVYEWIKELPYIKLVDESSDIDAYVTELFAMENMKYDSLKMLEKIEIIADIIKEL